MRSLQDLAIVLACICAGCASYQYDVVQPTDHAVRVISDQGDEFAMDGLQYRLIEYDNRLVMEIFNPTDAAIDLTGGSAVDPNGVSHPIAGQIIPPKGIVKEVLPPIRPAAEAEPDVNAQPQIGPVDRAGYVLPRGYNPSDPSGKFDQSPVYWDWDGEGEVHIHLTFDAGGKVLEHEFTFHRVKK